ncbi:hypothetical protein QF030_000315 [Streptomyces rishiriensis]|uniref:Mutator family transposase n=1 Tax=Streptomyces rishiriensis TaxID=68264 RepID=A0ABU0NGA3_STRRH|nr:hypothetical protein [Streptomyces rishiriensis]
MPEFVPFLQFDTEIRRVVCTTNAIESVNARIRRAVRARGLFPHEATALECFYMAVMSLDLTGQGRKRWTVRWKPGLQASDHAFDGRLSIGRRQFTPPELHRWLDRPAPHLDQDSRRDPRTPRRLFTQDS